MAPTRRLKQNKARSTIRAAKKRPSSQSLSQNHYKRECDNESTDLDVTLAATHSSNGQEASHTISTDDGEIIQIYSSTRIDGSFDSASRPLGDAAIYSALGTACHSNHVLYPRRSARLASSRPMKKTRSIIPLPVLERVNSQLQPPSSLNDIDSFHTPPKLTLDDLRRMRRVSIKTPGVTTFRPTSSKALFNNEEAFTQSFVASGMEDVSHNNSATDVDTDGESEAMAPDSPPRKRRKADSIDPLRRSLSLGNISPNTVRAQSSSRFTSRGRMVNEA